MTDTLRDVLTARIIFPEFSERLAVEPEALGVVRLNEFSDHLALAPGDLLAVNDEGVVTDVLEVADGWLVEAHFHMHLDTDLILHAADQWSNVATAVQVGLPGRPLEETVLMRSVFVLTTSEAWLNEEVRDNSWVEFVETRREPGMPVIFDPAGATDRW